MMYGLSESDWTVINENEGVSIPVTEAGLHRGNLSFVP